MGRLNGCRPREVMVLDFAEKDWVVLEKWEGSLEVRGDPNPLLQLETFDAVTKPIIPHLSVHSAVTYPHSYFQVLQGSWAATAALPVQSHCSPCAFSVDPRRPSPALTGWISEPYSPYTR